MRTLVIGGTGTVGTQVMARLAALGEKVAIMTRAADTRQLPGAVAVPGDLDEPAMVRRGLEGTDRVFLLVAQGPNETAQGLAAVAAARDARVSRLVYVSVRMPAFARDVPHFASKAVIEGAVRDSGIPYTILRPNNFFQNDLAFADVISTYGVYPQPIGGKGVARVDVRDIADAAAIVLTQPGHDGETYELNGPDLLTGEGVAAAYSRRLGRPVRYGGDSLDAWAAAVREALPAWLVHDLRIMYEKFQQHGLPSSAHDDERLRWLLGTRPRTFEAFTAELATRWRSVAA
jgi:uncharacterized protein YbjT (DUF2867 family)